MALYSGLCQGGPYVGKMLHHGLKTFEVVIKDGKPLTHRASQNLIAGASPILKFGVYEHRKGAWIWRET